MHFNILHSTIVKSLTLIITFSLLAILISFSAWADGNASEIIIHNNNSNNKENLAVQKYIPEDEVISTPTDDLWNRINAGYAMPELKSPYVDKQTQYFAAHPEYLQRMAQRSQKYLFHIVEEIEKRGMPTELALLPMVESAFNPKAYSSSRASGIWQFIPSTGKVFGLKQNWWVDNRRGVTEATDAALNYLEKLYSIFGSWDLALAAYNAGEGAVQRAIDHNVNNGLPTDYANLNLPIETKNYVPKLQAIKNILSNPEGYGVKIQTIPNQPYFTKVNAPDQIDVHLAAKLAGVSFEEFSALNPQYNRPVATSKGNVHEFLLPIDAVDTFKNNLSSYDKPLVNWQTYHAQRGEQVDNIAEKFGISTSELRKANSMPAGKKIMAPSIMLVPNNTNIATINSRIISAENEGSKNQDLNGKAAIETQDNIDADGLENNNIASNVGNDPPPPKKITRNISHRVKKGENLTEIANIYGMSAQQILSQNHLKLKNLKYGQMLKINFTEIVSKQKHYTKNYNKITKNSLIHKQSKMGEKQLTTHLKAEKLHLIKEKSNRVSNKGHAKNTEKLIYQNVQKVKSST